MLVKELVEFLIKFNQEASVVIDDNGSTSDTSSIEEHLDFNDGSNINEFFIVAKEWES